MRLIQDQYPEDGFGGPMDSNGTLIGGDPMEDFRTCQLPDDFQWCVDHDA